MHLAADPLLERRDGGQQLLIGAGGHPELQGGGEHRGGEVVGKHRQHRAGTPRAGRQARGGGLDLVVARDCEVLDGGDDQVVLGREVVQLRTTADPRALGDQRGRRTREADLHQALDARVEQPLAHGAGALLLRDTDGGHVPIVAV